jgi:hypothetical protein
MQKAINLLLIITFLTTNLAAQPGSNDQTFNVFDNETYWGNGQGVGTSDVFCSEFINQLPEV